MSIEASLQHQQLRDAILKRIQKSPDIYLDIGETFQSDAHICEATLMACDYYVKDFPKMLDTIKRHIPNFDNHKAAFLRFVERNCEKVVELYMKHFGAAIVEDWEFLTEAIKRDCHAAVFRQLPPALCMDVELLKLAVESIDLNRLYNMVLRQVPPEVLVKHEFILFRAMERGAFYLTPDIVPPSFWQSRDFIIKWTMESRRRVSIALIPTTFGNDREISLALYRSQSGGGDNLDEFVDWLPKNFLADKDFALECLRHDPGMFESCDAKLREDIDVFLTAALHASELRTFLNGAGESLVFHLSTIQTRLEAYDVFMTFLACLRKSRQLLLWPLSIVDCDDDTARGLKARIAGYLGFSGKYHPMHLKRVWREVLIVAQDCSLCSELIPLLPQQTILEAISKGRGHWISLKTYPDELWTNRSFVNWASQCGKFSTAISDEFSIDWKICLAYYKHSRRVREMTLPWISERLKSDKRFLLECLNVDPKILNYCGKLVLYDFEVLLKAVRLAMKKKTAILGLARTAVEQGWAHALVVFAKLLHMKIEAYRRMKSFDEHAGDNYFAHTPTIQPLINSYLGVDFSATQRREMQFVWCDHFIFCLALGRDIAELCESYEDWPDRNRSSFTFMDDEFEEDDMEEDKDDSDEDEEDEDDSDDGGY
jgi:hypothetical protein